MAVSTPAPRVAKSTVPTGPAPVFSWLTLTFNLYQNGNDITRNWLNGIPDPVTLSKVRAAVTDNECLSHTHNLWPLSKTDNMHREVKDQSGCAGNA